MNQQAERRLGTVIGAKWRVDALLGSGSMAAVYAVTHRNGARAALKILHPTLCADPAVCERFLGEGYLTNSVKHVGICKVQDDGVTDDGCVFLVMDLLEGDTLEGVRMTRGGRIPLVEALDLADKLMDVLAAVHAGGIIHRDLKPQNVFVCNDDTLKLLDFGVARVLDRGSQSKLSMFGLVLGTPSYMSPEQALGARDKVDHRSDIWSLGATMFTALSGETVHLGAHVQAKLLAAATIKARSIGMAMGDLPAPLVAAIDTALRFKKEDRWQSVDAFRRAVLEARTMCGLGLPAAAPNAFRSVPPPAGDQEDRTIVRIPGAPAAPNFAAPNFAPAATMLSPGQAASYSAPPLNTQQTAPMPYAQGPRASRPDAHEGSIPAVGGTLDRGSDGYDTHGQPASLGRKSGVPPWLVGTVVAAAALVGFSYWALRTPHAPVARGEVGAQTPTTAASTLAPVGTSGAFGVAPPAATALGGTSATSPFATPTPTPTPTSAGASVDAGHVAAAPATLTPANLLPLAPAAPVGAAGRVAQPTPARQPVATGAAAPRPPARQQPVAEPSPGSTPAPQPPRAVDDPWATPSPAPRTQPAAPLPGMGSDPFSTPE